MRSPYLFFWGAILILLSTISLFCSNQLWIAPYAMPLPASLAILCLGIYCYFPEKRLTPKIDTYFAFTIIAIVITSNAIHFFLPPSIRNTLSFISSLHSISYNTSLNLILLGISLYLKSHTHQKFFRILVMQFCFLFIFLNCLSSAAISNLHFSKLLYWQINSYTSVFSIISILIANVMIYFLWKRSEEQKTFSLLYPSKEIFFTSFLILCILVGSAALTGFYAAWQQYEKAQTALLDNAFSKKIYLLKKLETSVADTTQKFKNLPPYPNNQINQNKLLDLSLDTNFSSLRIFDQNKIILYSLGKWKNASAWSTLFSNNAYISFDDNKQLLITLTGQFKQNSPLFFQARWAPESLQYLFKDDPYFHSWICHIAQNLDCLTYDSQTNKIINQTQLNWNFILQDFKKSLYQTRDFKLLQVFFLNDKTAFILEFDATSWYFYLARIMNISIFLFIIFIILGAVLLQKKILPLVHAVIKEKNKAQESTHALSESENRFRQAFDASITGIALISLDGKILKSNPRFCALSGYSPEELHHLSLENLHCPEDWKEENQAKKQLLHNEIQSYHRAKSLITKSENTLWVDYSLILIKNYYGNPIYFMIQIQDISSQKKSEERLSLRAYFDALTGLANRHHLEQSLEKNISAALQQQQSFAIFFIDLDKFKQVNDTLGHEAGDILLKTIAERLNANTRSTDIVARLGGDEFIMVLSGLNDEKDAAHFAEKITKHIIAPIYIYGHELFITTSIGISFYPKDGNDAQTLIKNADVALYQAKNSGKNQYCFFNEKIENVLKQPTQSIASLEKSLEDAMEKNELELYFQPVQDRVTGRIIQIETLLRSQNAKLSTISIHSLIHIAIEAGIIDKLSLWILDHACSTIQSLRAIQPDLSISVNIAPYYFSHTHFISHIQRCLEKYNIPVSALILEFRENLLMQNPDHSLSILNIIKELGVLLTLDNFGSGCSSFYYLKKFPLHFIKIDRSLFNNSDLMKKEYLEDLIKFLSQCHIETIFEGVETKLQYDFIHLLPCRGLQGFFISQPLSYNQLSHFLTEHKDKLKV